MSLATPFGLLLLCLLLACSPGDAATVIHVAPDGDDAWTGATARPAGGDGPVASLARARDLVRALKANGGLPEGGVIVQLQPGVYPQRETFILGEQDSGTREAPIVYQGATEAAAPGTQPSVRILGGQPINNFTPVTDAGILMRLPENARGQVLQADLRAAGVDDFGQLQRRGMGRPIVPSHLELFYRNRPMTLARYPNEGWLRVGDLPDGARGTRFGYSDPAPRRWSGEDDVWVFGYWLHDWADEYLKVTDLDPEAGLLSYEGPVHHYGHKRNQRFYFLNVLSELDSPGEWYLDRASGLLYFWPPERLEPGDAEVSVVERLVQFDGVAHVDFRGMAVEVCRGQGITVDGGHDVRIIGCTLRNIGNRGVGVSGVDNGVVGCDIYDTGDGGIGLSGGDRRTLEPANLYAQNNHIRDYSRWSRTYRAAVGVSGVGNRVAHNLIHSGPHNAIQLGGNDHLIEFNELHSIAFETGDVGAFYMGRDWTARGTIIRNNYFHHIQGPGRLGAMGVYLDDQASGITIEGNVFYRVTRAMFIGGGDDNLVEGNLFVECVPAMHIDNRGMGWQKAATDDPKGTLRSRLGEVPYDRAPYDKYPNLAGILEDDPGVPKRNVVVHNVNLGGKWDDIHGGTRQYQTVEDNLVVEDVEEAKQHLAQPSMIEEGAYPAAEDLALAAGSRAFELGFEPLPLERIGLVDDGSRASWPVEHTVREMPAHQADTVAEAPRDLGPKPTATAARTTMPIAIDGTLAREEWAAAQPITLAQSYQGGAAKPTSQAWVLYDDEALYIAFDNAVSAAEPLRRGNTWGMDDAVEIALRPAGDQDKPIRVLRGYPSGHLEGAETELGPLGLKDAALLPGVEYAAEVAGPAQWTAEWRIPWSALALKPREGMKLALSLSVRKPASDLWLMWRGTGGNTWRVDEAGVLELGG